MTLDGKKTYITAAVMALASFALGMNWLTASQYEMVLGLLGALGLAALRDGVTKSGPRPFPGIGAGGPGVGQ